MRTQPDAYAFILPAFMIYTAFAVWPILQSLTLSFFEGPGYAPMRCVGLANFRELLQDRVFWKALGHNLVLVLSSLFLQLPLALALAVQRLVAAGEVSRDVLYGGLAAISLGLVEGQLLLDLSYEEDSAAEVDFNIVMTGDGRLIEVQGTAEGTPFDRPALDAMLDLAEVGIGQLLSLQRQVIRDAAGAEL